MRWGGGRSLGRNAASRVKEEAKYRWEDLREKAEVKGKKINEAAHENPWQAVAIAAAVAALVGIVVGKSKRDHS